MSDQDDALQDHGSKIPNNTFLSRIFGLQSDDIRTSIHTQDMSTFQMNTIDENEHSTGEDQMRVPESDQETSSEEGEAEDEDEDEHEREHEHEDNRSKDSLFVPPLTTDKSFHVHRGDETKFSSIQKIGQLSSDEETNLANEDDADGEEDRPLFDKRLKVEPSNRYPQFFQRVTQNNDNTKQNKKREQSLFTSPAEHQSRKQLRNGMRSFFEDVEPIHGNTGSRSFIFGNTSTAKTRFSLKRPNILKNVSILNNTPANKINTLSRKEKALWKWANVDNLDVFLQDIYNYYLGNGFTCIVLEKVLNIATLIFVVYISSYLGYCIDYSKITTTKRLADIKIENCYSKNITGFTKLLLWIFYTFVVLKIIQLYFDVKNLIDIHNFYNYLLNISDNELQAIPWQNVIEQIMFLKDQNALTANVVEVKAKNKIDAHIVANRIMRKDNYLIALYNNNILNLSLPIPMFRTNTLTKTLEWNINLCIMGFAFNESGFIKQMFLKDIQRGYIMEELRKRFMLAGFLNLILSPFLVTYFVMLYFFRYFNEYKTSPGSINARQYTPIAEWKFREHNELYHIFKKRIGLSSQIADKYIDQFPKEKTNLILKFVAFICGSFAAILVLLTIFDSENFLNFEIIGDKTVIFFITILGTIWSICRNAISDKYTIFNPEDTLTELASYTHYMPKEWEGRYHTEEIKNEFCTLYNLKIIILLRELASLVITPFILWFSLPNSAGKIVDFFRESSVYVDGLGYVCKYAVFDDIRMKEGNTDTINVSKGDNDVSEREATTNQPEQVTEEENDVAKNKMMQSYMYFIDDYENDANFVGKYQLPIRNNNEQIASSQILKNTYSWKKQFKPGQRPELFRIGEPNPNFANNGGKKQNHSNLTESFINARGSLHQYRNSELNSTEGTESLDDPHTGMLGLVKEYYKKSDVGR